MSRTTALDKKATLLVRCVTHLVGAALLLTTLTACSSQVPTAQSKASAKNNLTFTDASGTTINLNQQPQQIICLHTSCIDILAELGLTPLAVGAGLEAFAALPLYFGNEAKTFTQIPTNGTEPDFEVIAKLQPDLAVSRPGYESLREPLKTIVPLYLIYQQSYTDIIKNLKIIGRLTGRTQQAEAAEQRFREKLAAYKAKSPNNKTVMAMINFGDNLLIASNKSTICSLLAELAKCSWQQISGQFDGGWMPSSLEQVLEANPDVIFFLTSQVNPDSKQHPEQLISNPLWRELKAVKNRQVYEVKYGLWTGVGTRMLTHVLDDAMPKLYPEIFPQPLP